VKIGIFDPYLDTLGGGEKYVLTLSSCLSDKNEVSIFWDNELILSKGERKFEIDLKKVKTTKNIFSSSFSLKQRILETKKYDAIFYLSDGSIPLVWSKLFIHFQFPVKKQQENKLLRQYKYTKIAGIICNSVYTKNLIDKEFGLKSVVLYPPVDLDNILSKSDDAKKEDLILTVGRYNELSNGSSFKKHEVLIGFFKKISKNSKYRLVIVTDENKSNSDNLKELSSGYPITIVENLSKKELDDLYRKAKIYWHAAGFDEDLTIYPERAEHFGISTVEAMLSGAVPVVIKAGGQAEIISNGQDGFLWETENELIEKTKLLISNNQLWEKMSKAAREKGKKFSGKRFCKEVLEIIK